MLVTRPGLAVGGVPHVVLIVFLQAIAADDPHLVVENDIARRVVPPPVGRRTNETSKNVFGFTNVQLRPSWKTRLRYCISWASGACRGNSGRPGATSYP